MVITLVSIQSSEGKFKGKSSSSTMVPYFAASSIHVDAVKVLLEYITQDKYG